MTDRNDKTSKMETTLLWCTRCGVRNAEILTDDLKPYCSRCWLAKQRIEKESMPVCSCAYCTLPSEPDHCGFCQQCDDNGCKAALGGMRS